MASSYGKHKGSGADRGALPSSFRQRLMVRWAGVLQYRCSYIHQPLQAAFIICRHPIMSSSSSSYPHPSIRLCTPCKVLQSIKACLNRSWGRVSSMRSMGRVKAECRWREQGRRMGTLGQHLISSIISMSFVSSMI